jgi:hypothetical protein
MKKIIFVLSIVSLLLCIGVMIYRGIIFNQQCEGYLKRAADANSIELAEVERRKAIHYCEEKGLTSGYTSIFYRTPDEDLGFWFTNLQTSLKELEDLPTNSTSLEKSNMLLKLRETLTDQTGDGTSVTVPKGISRFPYNVGFTIWGWVSVLVLVISGVLIEKRHY